MFIRAAKKEANKQPSQEMKCVEKMRSVCVMVMVLGVISRLFRNHFLSLHSWGIFLIIRVGVLGTYSVWNISK